MVIHKKELWKVIQQTRNLRYLKYRRNKYLQGAVVIHVVHPCQLWWPERAVESEHSYISWVWWKNPQKQGFLPPDLKDLSSIHYKSLSCSIQFLSLLILPCHTSSKPLCLPEVFFSFGGNWLKFCAWIKFCKISSPFIPVPGSFLSFSALN